MDLIVVGLFLTILLPYSEQSMKQPKCPFVHVPDLAPGHEYQLQSPGHPNRYSGKQSCYWFVECQEEFVAEIQCPEMDIPLSPDCQDDQLNLFSEAVPMTICGNDTLVAASVGNRLSVGLISNGGNSLGGRFNCNIKCIKEESTSPLGSITSQDSK